MKDPAVQWRLIQWCPKSHKNTTRCGFAGLLVAEVNFFTIFLAELNIPITFSVHSVKNGGWFSHVPWCLLFEGTALPLGQRYGKIISFPSAHGHHWGYPLFSDKHTYHILGYIYIYIYYIFHNIILYIYIHTYPHTLGQLLRFPACCRVAVAVPGFETESLVPGESQWRGAPSSAMISGSELGVTQILQFLRFFWMDHDGSQSH